MPNHLVVVESPAKAKTLKKYLGKGFDVMASYGHVRDLIPKEGAVDPDDDFKMKYQLIQKNKKHVDAICTAVKKADALYLATDPDREGEAISWHLYEILKDKKLLGKKTVHRVVFHEITKKAIQQAINEPRDLSQELVNAQLARRVLDYLVGFNLSPLLWKKIRRGLSAGRVQSPALRMIVERELEIEKFDSREYWTIEADVNTSKKNFVAKLAEYQGQKVEQFTFTNDKDALEVKDTLEGLAKGKLKVQKVTKSQRKRNPAAPFTTSTMQQEAVRKLGFSAQRTMRVAQQLYEGIDIGEGAQGLITYMRTDSVNLAEEAVTAIRAFIAERYGDDCVPASPRVFKTKSKNAQEAHEAIRPTFAHVLPEDIKDKLTGDQYKLYNLIWKRTIACQMIHATIDQVAADLVPQQGEGNRFRANGSTIAIAGFMQLYLEGIDDSKGEDDNKLLPPLEQDQLIDLNQIRPEQHFTEPPPRFSEASLVKALEEYGIGRPSTYASIISTLQQREYVTLEQKRFMPTDVGRIVNKFLTNYFTQYVDYDFTARLEDELDEISRGEKEWVPLLSHFWQPFIEKVQTIEKNVQRKDVTHEELDEECPKCQKPLSIRLGKRGRFVGCTGYPDCDYTRSLNEKAGEEVTNEVVEGRTCPQCESDLVIKVGRYGKFIGCSAYPKCKFIESLEKPEDTNVQCPSCQQGSLMKRKSRYGTYFYSCNRYPDCRYAIKYPPIAKPCPSCNWPILSLKTTKRRGQEIVCPQKECGYEEPYHE